MDLLAPVESVDQQDPPDRLDRSDLQDLVAHEDLPDPLVKEDPGERQVWLEEPGRLDSREPVDHLGRPVVMARQDNLASKERQDHKAKLETEESVDKEERVEVQVILRIYLYYFILISFIFCFYQGHSWLSINRSEQPGYSHSSGSHTQKQILRI